MLSSDTLSCVTGMPSVPSVPSYYVGATPRPMTGPGEITHAKNHCRLIDSGIKRSGCGQLLYFRTKKYSVAQQPDSKAAICPNNPD